ncbi:hypothetical protein [Streptomyces sulphureus]|uniref:hypothetical protein n=1 Tax=Streptomyces sulphureus TaxID=47758 RepID=UPI00035EC33B|nr:hypothetical protein [Streptomyces sulphureus]
MAGLCYRRAVLLATARAEGGTWTTRRAYRTQRLAPRRRTARLDLAYLARTGHLTATDGTARAYTLPGGTR